MTDTGSQTHKLGHHPKPADCLTFAPRAIFFNFFFKQRPTNSLLSILLKFESQIVVFYNKITEINNPSQFIHLQYPDCNSLLLSIE